MPVSNTILLVDDHATNRELIREALDDSVYEISEAPTASEALEHLKRRETDMVITDVRMPGMSGMELLKRLHRDYPAVVVVLTSAFATVADAVEAMKLGAHHYLSQPVDIDELRRIIQRALGRRTSTGVPNPGFEAILGS